jgi:ABC-2 type transport system ATP-binding protein
MSVIAIEGLTKVFRSSLRGKYLYTLGPLDLRVDRGEIFGYLGPNGAGKTTTIKLAMGLLRPGAGSVLCFGLPCDSAGARRRIGFLPEQPYFYQHLTALELLEFYGDMFGLSRADNRRRAEHLLETVGLREFRDTAVSKFSKGMLQRIGVAQALINDPELVVLDEPMASLDPIGRRDIRDLILDLRSRGKTVFFSSHILQDVEMICDRVGILVGGRIVKVASVTEVLEKTVRWFEVEVDGLSADQVRRLGFGDVASVGEKTVVNVASDDQINPALSRLMAAGARVAGVLPVRPTLEDYFLSQVGGATRAQPAEVGAVLECARDAREHDAAEAVGRKA